MSFNSWPKAKLGDHVDLLSGFPFKSAGFTSQLDDIPLVKGENVHQGFIDWINARRWPRDQTADLERFWLRPGDVIVAMDRPWIPAGLKQAVVRKHSPRALLVQRVSRLRGTNGLRSDFLGHLIGSPSFTDYVKPIVTGVSVPHISGAQIKGFEFRLPPTTAQRRIASILSAYDDLIENNTRRIAILEEMARRIYEEWFVRFRFPGHENVRMVKSELGLVPEGWVVVAASAAIHVNPRTKVEKDGLKPFVAMNCLADGSMLIGAPDQRSGNSGSKFRNGDTLFARITPCLENGKTGFVQFLPSDEAVAFGSTEFIVLRSRTLTPEFVYLLARSGAFRDNAIKSMSGASGRQRVREACFDTFLLANPDQETLVKFAAVTRPMFQLVHSLALANANLRTTRDLLLPKLISGELDVSDLPDPEAAAA